jgi:DNA polymerase-3 subunit epsilon
MSRTLKLSRPLAILDLETTGTTPIMDRIVEIAILKVDPNGSTAEYFERVNPGIPIPPEATEVHGIGDDEVKECPPFEKFAPKINMFLKGCDLAGYNLIKFDLPFLRSEFARVQCTVLFGQHCVVDACRIFHRKEPRDLISAVKFFCEQEHSQAHSAEDDVQACWKVLKAQIARYKDLPLNLEGLHSFCNERDARFIDEDRKFQWRYNEATIAFGKNRGRPLRDVAEDDAGFLEWMLKADFSTETKQIAKKALAGKFPRRQQAPQPDPMPAAPLSD